MNQSSPSSSPQPTTPAPKASLWRSKALWWFLGGAAVIGVATMTQWPTGPALTEAAASQAAEVNHIQVYPRPIRQSLALIGTIEPSDKVSVSAPFDGPITQLFTSIGARVTKGQTLLALHPGQIEMEKRDAEVAVIKARQKVATLKNWAQSAEVLRAQNTLLANRLKVEELTRKADESRTLMERGIIPRNEYETVASELQAQKLQLDGAKQNLAAILEKGAQEHRNVANLELLNAEKRLDDLKRQAEGGLVTAPVSGLVLPPPKSGSDKEAEAATLQVGSRLLKGQVLAVLANTESLNVRATVDEIDVNRIQQGQPVTITGTAFEGTALQGRVTQIAAHAQTDNTQGTASASFEVLVNIPHIPPSISPKVRVGMSAKLDITTYDNPAALVVPVTALRSANGQSFVSRQDPASGQATSILVQVGKTLPEGVEILAGLAPGDRISTVADNTAPAPVAPLSPSTPPAAGPMQLQEGPLPNFGPHLGGGEAQ